MATDTILRLGPADHGRPMTLEEFLEADNEEGFHYELARGVLEVTQVPNDPHGQIIWNIYSVLRDYAREHPGVIKRAGGTGEFQLLMPGIVSGRNPDVAVVLNGTSKDGRGRRPPSFVAEVVSPRGEERDYEIKREEYLLFGIREYWIIDPMIRRVTLLVRDGDVWAVTSKGDDETIHSVVLPGLAVPVVDLWADTDDTAAE
jgi:Uma2 family endonuclease